MGKHGACRDKPAKPKLKLPDDGAVVTTRRPTLKWKKANCAETYNITVKDTATGETTDKVKGLTVLTYQTARLTRAKTYKWFAKACNSLGCAKSDARTMTVQ